MYELKLKFLNNICKGAFFEYKTLQNAFQNYLKKTEVILDSTYNYHNPEFEQLLENYLLPTEMVEKWREILQCH